MACGLVLTGIIPYASLPMADPSPDLQRLNRIRIVLVEPSEPGNIGSVARAMKNTGLSRLCLVNAADHRCGDARKMAVGAGDVLYGATECGSLAQALQGVSLAVGTTHRPRENFDVMYGPRHTAERMLALAGDQEAALVFGREQNGLTNDELQQCQIVAHVQTAVRYPSLNLSQAVLLFGYELFRAAVDPSELPTLNLTPHEEIEAMYAHIEDALDKLGFVSRHRPQTFMRSVRRIFGRIQLERRDVATIHRIFRQVDKYIARHEGEA